MNKKNIYKEKIKKIVSILKKFAENAGYKSLNTKVKFQYDNYYKMFIISSNVGGESYGGIKVDMEKDVKSIIVSAYTDADRSEKPTKSYKFPISNNINEKKLSELFQIAFDLYFDQIVDDD